MTPYDEALSIIEGRSIEAPTIEHLAALASELDAHAAAAHEWRVRALRFAGRLDQAEAARDHQRATCDMLADLCRRQYELIAAMPRSEAPGA